MVDSQAGRDTARVLTIPNVLSMLRLAGVPLFLWLLIGPWRGEADALAILVLALSGLTDWLDGVLARRLDQISEIGKLLDPFADRLYILAVLLGLAVRDVIPWWLAAAVPLRDVLLASMLLIMRRAGWGPWPVHFLGKAATFCLMYAFGLLFLGDGPWLIGSLAGIVGWAFVIWGTGLYWWAGVLYVYQGIGMLRRGQPEHCEIEPYDPVDPAECTGSEGR